MSVFFRAAYLFGFKPWDSGAVDSQVAEFVEKNPPGKSLDIGCGTGTNTVYLAEKGWDATGIDFVPRAINAARTKAARAGVAPRLIVGDVTKLTELGVGNGYGLLVDKGCFHCIPDDRRDAYLQEASSAAAPGATLLMFGFIRGDGRPPLGRPPGLTPGEVKARFAATWDLADEHSGPGMAGFAGAAWYTLRRR